MKYIAYGSNMSADQMEYRCPDAQLIGTGYIEGAQLEFYLHATVERSKYTTGRVPVAVWEITKADERLLDRYEGYPSYYGKEKWPVTMDDGSQIFGMVYTMNLIRVAPPTILYYFGIRDAYERLGFNSEIDTVLVPALRRARKRKQA